MGKKIEWCKAGEAGKYFGLSDVEVADLVKVIDALREFRSDIDLAESIGFVTRSSCNFEFFVGSQNDFEHGLTEIEMHKLSSLGGSHEILKINFDVQAIAIHRFSYSENFPHNLITYLASTVSDFYLASDDATDDERHFAQHVYDALNAVAEKRIFEKKFG
ncbi:hypothetical protein [Burkholderia cepacia]|uniref:Uncharacterized protein n=1 Tax=Burkholderia cepacia TaxID=292 RepID=A0A8I1AM49_BURCE|nr:hypothetical protein [Burkholderia cepacia]MBH9685122.1 hypothetical protein [Burkholderia cepacia]MBH9697965.1 hypothetical protein [Burkholderia cepacia]MBH9717675.1 hypothetical protein [Burkholderia cepacia]MBH9733546.1 hypothetical protein [Burkholderia cepacia]MBX3759907.1 hypothetical protein [Burkholderia cepacia]